MNSHDHLTLASKYGANNYEPLPVVIESAEGVWVTDVDGRRYMDMLSSYSALNFGHRHPELVSALKAQLDRVVVTSRAFCNDQYGPFCKTIAEFCGKEWVLPMNSGAEAVETAIKVARKWGYDRKGVPANEAEIICFDNNFHGRTTTIVSFSSDPVAKTGFGPFTPGFKSVPFGNADAVGDALTEDTVAVLVEPIQGEGGIIIPPTGFLQSVRESCKKNNVLLIADEIQTGLGRTGKSFAFEHESIEPDVLILGKALGGGLLPVSAVVSSKEVLEVMTPGTHGSTFGGMPLSCAVAKRAIEVLVADDLITQADKMGQYIMTSLEQLKGNFVKEIRGRGLLIGVEIEADAGTAKKYCKELMSHGVLCKDTHEQVIRFAPPLTMSKEEADWALERIELVLGRQASLA